MGKKVFPKWTNITASIDKRNIARIMKQTDTTTPRPKSAPMSWTQVVKGAK
jgi:hypothetical protein